MADSQDSQTGRKTVALYGGSFNPPHYGHFIAAFYAYHFLGVDEVWMMVTPQNPHKDPAKYAPLEDRVEMCELLAADHPWLKITDIEKTFPDTQTANTLRRMKETFADHDFVWVMGADNMATLHTWDGWQEIIDNHAIAILSRLGDNDDALNSPAAQYARHLHVNDASELQGKTSGWSFVNTPGFDISSSAIVEKLKNGERNIRDLPRRVEEKVLEKGLYETRPAPRVIPPAPQGPRF